MPAPLTPAQEAASDALESAINNYLQAYDEAASDEFLGDWVVLASLHNPDDPSNAPFVLIQPKGEIAAYKVLGLASLAQAIITNYEHDE